MAKASARARRSKTQALAAARAAESRRRRLGTAKGRLAAAPVGELYRQALESLPVAAVLVVSGRLRMNRAAEAMTGYRRSELATVAAWCAALHGAEASALRPCYDSGSHDGTGPPVSLAIACKDGPTRHVRLTIRRLNESCDLWVLIDLTEHDQAERTLRSSEDYLRSIVDTAPDGIITIDEHGTIETFNAAAERMFGYTAGEVVGRNVRLLMPPPYRDEHDGYIARYLKTREKRVIGGGREVVGLRKDGTTFPVRIACGEIVGHRRFTGVLHDLTDRRKLERRLAEIQLQERRHMAREIHDDVGGHLTGVGLLMQLLSTKLKEAGSPLAVKGEEIVSAVATAHERLRATLRGWVPLEATPEGLRVALADLAMDCDTRLGIRCRFECDPPVDVPDPVTGLHVFRIAQEAVNNAVRHGTPKQITVSLARAAQVLEVTVSDDGCGLGEIPAGHPGTGLEGMRERVEILGGTFSVQSALGHGTLIRAALPLRLPKEESE